MRRNRLSGVNVIGIVLVIILYIFKDEALNLFTKFSTTVVEQVRKSDTAKEAGCAFISDTHAKKECIEKFERMSDK